MHWDSIRHNITIILVEPEHPGNIGSVARAMKVNGLSSLILVNPVEFTDETWWLAHGSEELLKEARTVTSFREAAASVDHLVVTSAKTRAEPPTTGLRETAPALISLAKRGTLGLALGRERTGLKRGELLMGERAVTIPTFAPYPSLNLAMAATVLLYELATVSETTVIPPAPVVASQREKMELSDHFRRTLGHLNYTPPDHERIWASMGAQFLQMLQGARLTAKQVRMMHKYFHMVGRDGSSREH